MLYWFFKDGPSIPCAFDTYDANNDDVITRNEFLQATSGLPQTTSAAIFIRMDNNRKLLEFLVCQTLYHSCVFVFVSCECDDFCRMGR